MMGERLVMPESLFYEFGSRITSCPIISYGALTALWTAPGWVNA